MKMKKIVNVIILFILKFYNQLYFKKIQLIGRENIPDNGAILFSPNHQNALLDPILVGTNCRKSIYSLTRSDVFDGPLKWLLSAMQTLPIYRVRDGFGQLKKNQGIFEQCFELFKLKKHLMMFSEGKHHDQYYLLRLSKGSSRLALEAQKRTSSHPIYLQPVGINYTHYTQARQYCTLVFGQPINVNDYLASYKIDPAKTINQLRDQLQLAMEECLWIPKNDTNYLNKKKFINKNNTRLPFLELKKALNQTPNQLIPNHSPTSTQKKIRSGLGIINFPVYLLVRWLMSKFEDPVFHGTVNYFGGLILFPIWWTLGALVFFITINIYWSLGFIILSLLTHYIRISYGSLFKR